MKATLVLASVFLLQLSRTCLAMVTGLPGPNMLSSFSGVNAIPISSVLVAQPLVSQTDGLPKTTLDGLQTATSSGLGIAKDQVSIIGLGIITEPASNLNNLAYQQAEDLKTKSNLNTLGFQQADDLKTKGFGLRSSFGHFGEKASEKAALAKKIAAESVDSSSAAALDVEGDVSTGALNDVLDD